MSSQGYGALDLLIGQLFIIGLHGYEVGREFDRFYRRYPAGGVILFERNIRDAEQLKRLTTALTRLGEEVSGNPPLIAVDQEGGNLSPLRGVVTSLPGNMGLAATGEPDAARYAGFVTGRDLGGLGINLILAPVLDLAANPDNPVLGTRAFSDEPGTAALFGLAFARGVADAGLLFTAKHFPGHGSCREDSHITLPVCPSTRQALLDRDIEPFRAVLTQDCASVMLAHIKYPELDPACPASLSPAVIGDLLRRKLGFGGVVITDDLEMGGVSVICPPHVAALRAIEAGADAVLICHTPAEQAAGFDTIKQAVRSGRLPLARLEEAAERLAVWRAKAGRRGGEPPTATEWTPATLAERVVAMADATGWPCGRAPLAVVTPAQHGVTPAENEGDLESLFGELDARSVPWSRFCCAADPSSGESEAMAAKIRAAGFGRIVLVLRHPGRHAGQGELARRLAQVDRLLLLSVRDPREAAAMGGTYPLIATYSSEPPVLAALARVLCGELRPQGGFPVRLSPAVRASGAEEAAR